MRLDNTGLQSLRAESTPLHGLRPAAPPPPLMDSLREHARAQRDRVRGIMATVALLAGPRPIAGEMLAGPPSSGLLPELLEMMGETNGMLDDIEADLHRIVLP